MPKISENFNIFPVTVYGEFQKFNDTISKCRCRIFYKGENRNGTYITDEFAEKLLSTITYAPVKGIYDNEDGDYTDHGTKRSEGRIYGIVPADHNLTWEDHLDSDGVTRTYACVDVLVYTAIYPEAAQICDSAQSMELYRPSIRGEQQIINGKPYFVFTDGAFLGLQVLGKEVEPCFEGAAFFSLYQSLLDQVSQLEKVQTDSNNGQGGNDNMGKVTFKLCYEGINKLLWENLNPSFNEEGNWEVNYTIICTYDDYAVVQSPVDGKFARAYYTKDDEANTVTIDSIEECFMIDVTAEEKIALEALRAINGDSYTEIDQKVNSINEELTNANLKITEQETTISTLTTERDNNQAQYSEQVTKNEELVAQNTALSEQYAAAQTELATITEERDNLVAYRKGVEDQAKTAVIANYLSVLDADTIARYTEARDQYTVEELDIKLTYEQKKAHPEQFGQAAAPKYVLKDEGVKGGLEEILSRYEKH